MGSGFLMMVMIGLDLKTSMGREASNCLARSSITIHGFSSSPLASVLSGRRNEAVGLVSEMAVENSGRKQLPVNHSGHDRSAVPNLRRQITQGDSYSVITLKADLLTVSSRGEASRLHSIHRLTE